MKKRCSQDAFDTRAHSFGMRRPVRFLATLTGKKFLLKGNHDKNRAAFYRSVGFELLNHSWPSHRDST